VPGGKRCSERQADFFPLLQYWTLQSVEVKIGAITVEMFFVFYFSWRKKVFIFKFVRHSMSGKDFCDGKHFVQSGRR
jgi:hypothetical protein